jgi:outer membrane protein TolC
MPLRLPSPGRAAILASALTAALNLTPATHGQTSSARVLSQAGPPASRPVAPAGSGATTAPPVSSQPVVQRLTLEEAKQRVVANSKLLALAATNVDAKGYATRALRANYFPQIVGNAVYFHFNDDLGTVLTTPGRHVNGPGAGRCSTSPARRSTCPC